MNSQALIQRLAANREIFQALVRGLTAEQSHWRPASDKWSMVEVINHLLDEEKDDFRRRLDLTLHSPDVPWPPIDPVGWARDREYNRRELKPSVDAFLSERERSLIWLESLVSPDWTAYRTHPAAGTLSAGDLLAAWVAHDFLHQRQISRLHWAYVAHLAAPYSVRYAGE